MGLDLLGDSYKKNSLLFVDNHSLLNYTNIDTSERGKFMKLSKIKASKAKEVSVQDLSKGQASKGLVKKTKLDRASIEGLIDEKTMIDAQVKSLTERKETITERIKMIAEENGVKDNNGSFNFKFEYNGEEYMICKNARTSRKFNMDKALMYFRSKRKELLSSVVDTVEVINEQKVESLVIKNKLKASELSELFEVKVTYAGLLNKIKEEQEDKPEVTKVEQSTRTSESRRIRRR